MDMQPTTTYVRWLFHLFTLTALAAGAGACTDSTRDESDIPPAVITIDGITYRATTETSGLFPVRVKSTLTATNTLDRPVNVEYGGCSFSTRAYRTGSRSDEPVWDERRQEGYACTLNLLFATIMPGEAHSMRHATSGPIWLRFIRPSFTMVVTDFNTVVGENKSPRREFEIAS